MSNNTHTLRGQSFNLAIHPSVIYMISLFLFVVAGAVYGYLLVVSAVQVTVLKDIEHSIGLLEGDISSLEAKAVSLEAGMRYGTALASGYVPATDKIFIENAQSGFARR